MKNFIIVATIATLACNFSPTYAQTRTKTKVDTSKAMKRNPQPFVVPPEKPLQQPSLDSLPAVNKSYYDSAVRRSEYQNRGAEDRRNPVMDPNVIPNKRVPANEPQPPVKTQ